MNFALFFLTLTAAACLFILTCTAAIWILTKAAEDTTEEEELIEELENLQQQYEGLYDSVTLDDDTLPTRAELNTLDAIRAGKVKVVINA